MKVCIYFKIWFTADRVPCLSRLNTHDKTNFSKQNSRGFLEQLSEVIFACYFPNLVSKNQPNINRGAFSPISGLAKSHYFVYVAQVGGRLC